LGAASWQGEGLGWGRKEKGEEKGREGEVHGRKREGPQVTVEPGPLRALLRHCSCTVLANDNELANIHILIVTR